MRPLSTRLALVLLLAGLATAQQQNSPQASAIWQGQEGPPWPVVTSVSPVASGALSLDVAGAPLQGYGLFAAGAGTTAPGLGTAFGLLDLDLTSGVETIMDGAFLSTGTALDGFARTDLLGGSAWSWPLAPLASPVHLGLQVLISDPGAAFGYTLSAATDLTLLATGFVHVSATTGAPGNPGTAAAPVDTVSAGLALASAGDIVRVAVGTYVESLVLPDGVSVIGGLDAATWTATGQDSVIMVPSTGALASGITQPTVIRDLELVAADATGTGQASVALVVNGASDGLVFDDCVFTAGNGTDGSAGSDGVVGGDGTDGGSGPAGGFPGIGGGTNNGGGQGGFPDQDGWDGDPGPIGGPGGQGGDPCGFPFINGGPGGMGHPGSGGTDGLLGNPAPLGGSVVAGSWVAGDGGDGENGQDGGGGGGGGGGGDMSCSGSGGMGGGGGGGGGGGTGGTGGGGGGASIAVFLHDASPRFMTCSFEAASGGAAGDGGAGALGGMGGNGGQGEFASGNAGDGGDGGHGMSGGAGGGGAGGSGGPSFCVYLSSTTAPVFTSPTYLTGSGGAGGAGGLHGNGMTVAPSGSTGPVGTVGP